MTDFDPDKFYSEEYGKGAGVSDVFDQIDEMQIIAKARKEELIDFFRTCKSVRRALEDILAVQECPAPIGTGYKKAQQCHMDGECGCVYGDGFDALTRLRSRGQK